MVSPLVAPSSARVCFRWSLLPQRLALIYLANLMKDRGGNLIDCQFETPHLKTMGGEHISYDEYMKIISEE